ncbi:TatD family hydrolase [Candidatus Dependentiae bacterium]|nr:TatD family hydrolase [Candidatus Dependentiae bacterium]
MLDVHCHLYDEKYDDILTEAVASELSVIVNSGDCIDVIEKCKAMSDKFSNLYFSAGVHPHNAEKDKKKISEIFHSINHPKCIGIGEIGLDYYYSFSEKNVQKSVFENQIKIAADNKKNMIIHSRNAEKEVYDILKEINSVNVLVHCYTGQIEILEKMIECKNFYFSIGGMITFKKNQNIIEILKLIPLSKLLVETDSPYLTPLPHRGKINMPKYVEFIYLKISSILGINFPELDKLIEDNFKKFSGISL